MSVWKKQSVKWLSLGKQVPSGTAGATKKTIESKRFYGTVRQADGRSKQVPLFKDKDQSIRLLVQLQAQEDRDRELGITKGDRERLRPLHGVLKEFQSHLESKGNSKRYIKLIIRRLEVIFESTQAKTSNDLEAASINRLLDKWEITGPPIRQCGKKITPLSSQTRNHYVRNLKTFSRWLYLSEKSDNDLLRGLNTKPVQKTFKRRSLNEVEKKKLLQATKETLVTIRGLKPQQRAMLYHLALFTGLRVTELASLDVLSFDLDRQLVTIEAAYSKRRKRDRLPIHDSLIEPLQMFLSQSSGKLFPGNWHGNAASMLRKDLKNAGIDVETVNGIVDFHALRHTFITTLASSGVSPQVAKDLARHSTITLTMDVYSHVEPTVLGKTLNTLKSIE